MSESTEKPAPHPTPRRVVLAEGCLLAAQRFCKAKAEYLANECASVEDVRRSHERYLDASTDLGDWVLLAVYGSTNPPGSAAPGIASNVESGPGMEPGQMYRIYNPVRGVYFDGHLLNGIFWNNYTRVGYVDGDRLIYNLANQDGSLYYRDGVAGRIEGLTLIMRDGEEDPSRFELHKVE